MRFAILTVIVVGLTAGTAEATSPRTGTLIIKNECDDAVQVKMGRNRYVLEPNSSTQIPIAAAPDYPTAVTLEAKLGKSRATEDCTVYYGETTTARVICTPSGNRRRPINLDIVCEEPLLASLIREAGVLTASTGGLAGMLLLSALLGRMKRRREDEDADDEDEGGFEAVVGEV